MSELADPKPGSVAAFREHLDWITSRAQLAVLVAPGTSANEKYNESHDPTTNYGAW